jgi:hypothetical protein
MLTSELVAEGLDRDGLGLAIARALTVCDLTLQRSVVWLFPGRKEPPQMGRESRQAALFERYAEELSELSDRPLDDGETELT